MATDTRLGEELAGYRIEALLGRGGMGVVYRARQLSLERLVALKVMAPELSEDEEFRRRFLREARIAAALDHPHVLPVYEAGEAEGVLYLAMRFVEGESLAQIIQREAPLDPVRSVSLVTQVAEALEAAHGAGLVHRDVKPANVLVARVGAREHAYLFDFGVARRTQGASELTEAGDFLGSISYAAPEQIRGEQVDARTDLYALGCLLHECLTGKPPFVREHDAAVIWAHVNDSPPLPSSARPELGVAFDGLLERALAKDPGERFQSSSEIVAALASGAVLPARRRRPAETSLPTPASSFLGRERELREIGELLAREDVRLLTLTGPGGTGKTRLALQAATEAAERFPDGVFWVPLAPLRDPALVLVTAEQALSSKNGLAEHIAERELLLLLDNLEQVIEAAPELSELLTACPNLTLLVTSRELLRVQGEVEYAVPPLASPEALSLFCERSQLEPSEEIAELCARLDNLPLAVELAAARTKALSPTQILARLSQRLDLLKGGRGADPRQQTLRATIEWSYDLLSDEEQRLFVALSVFAGGCTLEAAEDVCDADLDTLQSLVEKSLLRFSNERYWMLETIREYGEERLENSPDAEGMGVRHADFVLQLASQLEATSGSDAANSRFALEQDNVRRALAWAESSGHVDLRLEVISRSWPFWWYRGHSAEGARWVESALVECGSVRHPRTAKVLAAGAMFASRRGDLDAMNAYATESLEIAREFEDAQNTIWPLILLGVWATHVGDYEEAKSFTEEAIAVARDVGDRKLTGIGLNNLGDVALRQGEFVRAAALFEEALEISRELGTSDEAALEIINLAWCLHWTGRFNEAAEAVREGLLLAREIGNFRSLPDGLVLAGALAHRRGNSGVGARLLGAGELIADRVGDVPQDDKLLDLTVERLVADLGASGYARALREGGRMSLDEALETALASLD